MVIGDKTKRMNFFDKVMNKVRKGQAFNVDFADLAVNGKIQAPRSIEDYVRASKHGAREHNPIAPNQADIVNWVLYDRTSVAANTAWPALTKLFTQPIGQNSKTKVDTNLEQVSRLPDPLWFNCTGLGFFFNPNAAPVDVFGFIAATYMEFWVGQKPYLEGPVQCFPTGGGTYLSASSMSITAGAGNTVNNTTNGMPAPSSLFDTRLPAGMNLGVGADGNPVVSDGLIGITILQGQTFNVQLKQDGTVYTNAAAGATPVGGVGLTVGCYLHGILSRGVQ